MNYVYHSSKIQNLKVIEPNKSTHNETWVYAFRDPEPCMMMIGNNSDFINQVGFLNSVPYIAERFEGALEYAFNGMSGSIYKLDATDFKEGMTTFKRELVCDHECEVISEVQVENILDQLLLLEKEGKILIYKYDNFPDFIPSDKSDLVERALMWMHKPGNYVLETITKFHPDILEDILRKDKERNDELNEPA